MDAETRWVQNREWAEESKRFPKCPAFPDCSCNECHSSHEAQHEINDHCHICQEQKCIQCDGEGWYKYPESEDYECTVCDGTGRIKK